LLSHCGVSSATILHDAPQADLKQSLDEAPAAERLAESVRLRGEVAQLSLSGAVAKGAGSALR